MKIPEKLEEWIDVKWQEIDQFSGGNAELSEYMESTAQEILTNPTKYGLVEVEKVSGLIKTIGAASICVCAFPMGSKEMCKLCKALADWDKIKVEK